LLARQKRLGVGEWKNHIFRRKLHGLGELQSGGIILSDFERLDGLFEVNIRQSCLLGLGGLLCHVLENLGVDRLSRLIAAVPVGVVVVGVIVVIRTADLAGDWVVAVPVIGMAAVPVVAGISVTERPVTAQADEHVLAMIIRIHITEREPWPAAVMHRKTIPRPDGPAADTVVVISVNVVMVIRVSDQVRPVMIDDARRPERIVSVQARRGCS